MGIDLRGAEATSVEWSSNGKKMPRVGVHFETKTKGTKMIYSRHQHYRFIDIHIIKASLSANDYISPFTDSEEIVNKTKGPPPVETVNTIRSLLVQYLVLICR